MQVREPLSAGLVYFHLPLDNLSKKGVLLER
jgi:hypothetical protein